MHGAAATLVCSVSHAAALHAARFALELVLAVQMRLLRVFFVLLTSTAARLPLLLRVAVFEFVLLDILDVNVCRGILLLLLVLASFFSSRFAFEFAFALALEESAQRLEALCVDIILGVLFRNGV